jgi:hypothetical protein
VESRLEAGWIQRIAWSALVWISFGLLAWVPFLYVAIRRRRPSDWGAFAAFVLYEVVTLPWAAVRGNGSGDPVLGAAALLTWLIATAMLLFAVFDKRTPRPVPVPGIHPAPPGQQPYGYHPYGR